MALDVVLRPVVDADVPIFHAFELDPAARYLAAFVPAARADPVVFHAHWARLRADPDIINRTIVADGRVAGSLGSFLREGQREVCYWLGREFWGQGIGTRALATFVQILGQRPLYAGVAHDNFGSLRVLAKCGFRRLDVVRGFAEARGCDIDEIRWILETPPPPAPLTRAV